MKKIYPVIGGIVMLLCSGVYAESRLPFEPEMVKLPNGKWMGKYEVTIGEYMACVNDGGCPNPKWLEEGNQYNIKTGKHKDTFLRAGMSLKNKRHPITGVLWKGMQKYITWLNEKTGKTYYSPREEEWLEACQAGKTTEYCGSDDVDSVAWYAENSSMTHEVGKKKPNDWGLYDMSGNVSELTIGYYEVKVLFVEDSHSDNHFIERGGAWNSSAQNLTLASPHFDLARFISSDVGFRVARM